MYYKCLTKYKHVRDHVYNSSNIFSAITFIGNTSSRIYRYNRYGVMRNESIWNSSVTDCWLVICTGKFGTVGRG